MSIKVMKQALEALLDPWTAGPEGVANAITSLRQAIEQAEKQVAFKIYKRTPPRGAITNVRDAELPWVYDQDPSSGHVASMWVTPVKATPQPQREWVGLTDEEITELRLETFDAWATNYEVYKVIEAKLKEKNA